jgi:hypothetical protein
MTGKELWDRYGEYNEQVSQLAPKFLFAGFAIGWIFKDEQYKFPTLVYFAFLFFILCGLCLLLQPFLGGLVLKCFIEKKEEEFWIKSHYQSIEGDIQKPRSVDRIAFGFQIAKVTFLIIAYLLLFIHIGRLILA